MFTIGFYLGGVTVMFDFQPSRPVVRNCMVAYKLAAPQGPEVAQEVSCAGVRHQGHRQLAVVNPRVRRDAQARAEVAAVCGYHRE